jgi:glutathione synthase/RimK-type ligase-like ATP-grasp enzyme
MIYSKVSKVKFTKEKTLINWGSSTIPYDMSNVGALINNPEAVGRATNKRTFFELCREAGGVSIPDFTLRHVEAEDWLRDNHLLFARTKLQGSGGEGIVEVPDIGTLGKIQDGTLLVKYVKKKHEFRVHIGDGKVMDIQEKRKRTGVPLDQMNWRIRSAANGFVFCRQDVKAPPGLHEEALKAFAITGLDFGAVDVIYNERHNKCYVLEVNTAPGLEGSTLINYQKYFQEKLSLKVEELSDHYDVTEFARKHGIELHRE